MELKINEYKLRLGGVANLATCLEWNSNYDLVIKNAEVREVKDINNDDGTINKQFTLKISELSEIQIIGKGEVISAKKKGSQSKILRYELQIEADNLGINREQHYQNEMSKIINEVKERNVI